MISTQNITQSSGSTGSVKKIITPGTWTVKINSVELSTPPYDNTASFLVLNVEGPDMGPSFEGFFIDKDNPALGRHKGQIGRIKTNYYAYKDGELPSGEKIQRDQQILRAIYSICITVGKGSWIDEVDNKYATIEAFVKGFNDMIKGTWIKMVIGGKEYERNGYTNYDLHLVKNTKTHYNIASADGDASNLITFNENEHIKKSKVESVSSFGDDDPFKPSDGASAFEL